MYAIGKSQTFFSRGRWRWPAGGWVRRKSARAPLWPSNKARVYRYLVGFKTSQLAVLNCQIDIWMKTNWFQN